MPSFDYQKKIKQDIIYFFMFKMRVLDLFFFLYISKKCCLLLHRVKYCWEPVPERFRRGRYPTLVLVLFPLDHICCLLNNFLRDKFLSLRAEDEARHVEGSDDVEDVVSVSKAGERQRQKI